MKKILKGLGVFVLSAAMVGIFSLPVMAQAPTGRKYKANGAIDLDFAALDYKNSSEVDSDTYSANIGFGFFISDMFEVGPEIIYLNEEEGNDEFTVWALGVKGNVHFNTNSPVIPYVGLNFAFSSVDMGNADDTSIMYGLQAGLDYFLTEHVSINPELRYTTGGSYNFNGTEMDISSINLMIGIAAHF